MKRPLSSPTGTARISKIKVSCIICQDNAGKGHTKRAQFFVAQIQPWYPGLLEAFISV